MLVIHLPVYSIIAISIIKCFSDKDMAHLIPDNYSTRIPLDSKPVILNWLVNPHIVSELSAIKMEFSVDLTVHAYWLDSQLRLNTKELISLPHNIAKKLWFPWIRFQNCKDCNSEVINPQQQSVSLEDQQILIVFRKTYKFICIFDLSHYPFDKQQCNIDVKIVIWHGPIKLSLEREDKLSKKMRKDSPILVPPEYILDSFQRVHKFCPTLEPNVTYICFSYVFVFKRISTQHILLVFLPSMLIVILSWISFWLDVEMAAPRVALGLTSLLTLATQFNSAQRNLPAVATIKALDIWMFVCIFMVFASLLVYATSFTCNRLKKLQTDISPINQHLEATTTEVHPPNSFNVTLSSVYEKYEKYLARRRFLKQMKLKNINVDQTARIIFPLFYLIFNIYFWANYL